MVGKLVDIESGGLCSATTELTPKDTKKGQAPVEFGHAGTPKKMSEPKFIILVACGSAVFCNLIFGLIAYISARKYIIQYFVVSCILAKIIRTRLPN